MSVNIKEPLPILPPEGVPANEAQRWLGMGLASQAILLNDRQQLLKNERLTVAHHRATYLGQPMPDEDEQMIHIGDITTHHHQENPPALPLPVPASGGLSGFAKTAICTAIAATGIGLPLGGYFIADAIKGIKPASPVVTPADPGSQYDLKLLD